MSRSKPHSTGPTMAKADGHTVKDVSDNDDPGSRRLLRHVGFEPSYREKMADALRKAGHPSNDRRCRGPQRHV